MLLVKIPKKNTPVAGTQFALRPAIGPTYEFIDFYLSGGLTLAMLKDIRVEIRGKPIQVFKSGVQMQDLNKFYRRPQSDRTDMVRLWFFRPELETVADSMQFAMGTADVDTFAIVMDIDESAPVGSDLVFKARVSAPRKFGICTKIKQYPQTFAQAGEQDIADLPRRDTAIAGLHLSTDKVTDLRLELDSLKVVEGSVASIHDAMTENCTPQAAYTHLSYLARGRKYDALQSEGVQDFRLTLNLSEPVTFSLLVEYFDSFDGI